MQTLTKQTDPVRVRDILYRDRAAIKRALDATVGLWRNRKIDPLRYQRAMRKQYTTVR